MKSFFWVLIPFLLFQVTIPANDGAFFARGNQLIPIFETDISVQKEILTIKKVRNEWIEVTVYYEFYNPGNEKSVTVGFEAASPDGDVDATPKKGLHPYMRDFTVNLNGQLLPYSVAYVEDSIYVRAGKISSIGLTKALERSAGNENYVDFNYVYHFDARFKKGINVVKHTYSYTVSSGVEFNYLFEYVLTAANRWANHQIDDFTLIIDMGEFEDFYISHTFFGRDSEWIINGIGKSSFTKAQDYYVISKDATHFFMQKGTLVFQKKNFKPRGEIDLYSLQYFPNFEGFDYKTDLLPLSIYAQDNVREPKDEMSKKILKNLPFARRGYVFTSDELKTYYAKMPWYIPNPNYDASVDYLWEEEKTWIEKWK